MIADLMIPAEAARLLTELGAEPQVVDGAAITLAWVQSPYLRGLMRRVPEALATYLEFGPERVTESALASIKLPSADGATLRQAKAAVGLATALADIAGHWPLEKVTAALSELADAAIDRAIRIAVTERVPGAGPEGFVAIALGKLGSLELNYSSDVDLILLYDRDRLAVKTDDDPDNAAVRIARQILELMQARDADGYVFRVDLRLRPTPEVTPIAMPVRGAETYYQSEALTWERAAFIRARSVGGDIGLGNEFLAAVEPFVWRRSLDYTAVRDIQDISLQIRDHFDDCQQIGPGYDLKRGRGGIREVEFFTQIHQLIFGGRDYALRAPATLDALEALVASGRVERHEADALAKAYRTFRTAEHRLQMIDDEQTHQIPTRAPERKALAVIAGFADWAAMESELKRHAKVVGAIYDALIAETEVDRLPRQTSALTKKLKSIGVVPSAEFAGLIGKWRRRPYRGLRSDAAMRAFESALPGIASAFAKTGVGRQALLRFDNFLSALPQSIQFFALVEANPRVAPLLGRVLELAPVLAEKLGRRPELLDIMLASEAFDPLPGIDELIASLTARTDRHDLLEVKLDEVRRWVAERRFQIGIQLIEGRTDPLKAAGDYAKLADSAIAVLAPAVEDSFAAVHGHVPGGRLVILGFGRYGGAMLTEKSDLDIVYLFSGRHDAQSDGTKPLAATTYFNRLSQRLTAALSVETTAGPLYEVDTRLRPSGAKGLLAVSIETFIRYQLEDAWSWEHMALTRARLVFGAVDGDEVEAGISTALQMVRDTEKLKAEVIEMRGDMVRARYDSGFWDMKHSAGGLVDLEFAVHFLQLSRREGFHFDFKAAIQHFIDAGVLKGDLISAHDLMTRLLIMLRLIGGEDPAKLPDNAKAMLAAAAGYADFANMKAALAEAKRSVGEAWISVFGSKRRVR